MDGISVYAMPEWFPVLLDDPFEDWRECKHCGLQLLPEDEVRVIGYKATLCFHCAIISLPLKARGRASEARIVGSIEQAAGWRRVPRGGAAYAGLRACRR